ncbi:ABC transporter permease [Sporomusa aerivorans]|uniref:ABC transporter permease n=1 Tax=Sporomusa aerivorans TaxID=204936 RepID=UPI00352A0200
MNVNIAVLGEKSRRIVKQTLAIFLVLALWQILPSLDWVDPHILPPLSKVIEGFFDLVTSGKLFVYALASFKRAVAGFTLAIIIGIPLGLLMGWNKQVEQIFDPIVQLSRNTATLALYPVFILVFGLGELSKIGIIFWGCVWTIIINTIAGVRLVDPLLIKAARSMAVSGVDMFRKVILPAAIPSIITGLRLSATYSIVVLVSAEILGSNSGLGFLIFEARDNYDAPALYSGIIILSALGLSINYAIVQFEKRLTHWQPQTGHK